jgi:OOP family OmpA-OmpF porin
MARLVTFSVAGALMLATAGCAGLEYGEVKSLPPASNPYAAALQKGYVQLSKDEWNEGDYRDSDTFAGRAEASAKGTPPRPEEISARTLPADKVSELTSARQRLVTALDGNATQKNPAEAARAQVMFDCWMQEQEENFQPRDIATCRDGFNAAMAKLEEKAVAPSAMAVPANYMVFFDWDKYNLTPQAKDVIRNAVANASKEKATSFKVVGHTDTSGSAEYNLGLSKRRSASVAQDMTTLGVGKAAITTEGRGEKDLLVPTKDGVREPQNRRAVISFGKPGA